MKRNLADKIQKARTIGLIVAHRHLIFNEYDFNGLTRQLIPVDIQEYNKTASAGERKPPSGVAYLLKHLTDYTFTGLSQIVLKI